MRVGQPVFLSLIPHILEQRAHFENTVLQRRRDLVPVVPCGCKAAARGACLPAQPAASASDDGGTYGRQAMGDALAVSANVHYSTLLFPLSTLY